MLLGSILLIIARWRYPHNQQQSGSTLALWREVWRQWHRSRSREKEREADMRAVRGKSALVVDPDEKSSRVLVWRLESLGCTVSKARNGVQGLSVARSAKPEFIICDALLTDVSAAEFHGSLSMPNVPVVFVGALAAQREELAGLGERVACLSKPFDPDNAVVLAGRLLRATNLTYGHR